MAILNYLIWNGSPELFRIGPISGFGPIILRWYGLFFALGFLISQQILYYFFKKEGKPEKDVDTLTLYMVIATIIGARLGHVFFYEPDRFLSNPIDILKIWEGGLASHGATVAILIALWFYSLKKKPGQNYLQTLDRIVILAAITSALIRIGNYFNSEIIGKPTDRISGVVFVNRLTDAIGNKQIDSNQIVDFITYKKNESIASPGEGLQPISIYLFFKPNTTEEQATAFITNDIKELLAIQLPEYFQQIKLGLDYEVTVLANGSYGARINTLGISRHPTQLYEALGYVILFLLLLALWFKYKNNLPTGRNFGIFLIACFGLRFFLEFLKEPQVEFENDMFFNMGQLLSVPLIIGGILVLLWSYKKTTHPTENKI